MIDKPLVEMIKRHEGLRLNPYRCTSGKLTIGYGRNLEDKGISEKEALILLENDLNDVIASLYKYIPWFFKLDVVRQDVLTNMCFNLGIHGLLQFKKTLRAIQDGDYDKAADEMLDSKWAEQVKSRAMELSRMMRTGQYIVR